MSHSLRLARAFLGQPVTLIIDRPLGSAHPEHGTRYELNYGYLPGTLAPDGEPLDAYVVGVEQPLERFAGRCLAIVHRADDDDDKLVVAPEGMQLTREAIAAAVRFQERTFHSRVIMDGES